MIYFQDLILSFSTSWSMLTYTQPRYTPATPHTCGSAGKQGDVIQLEKDVFQFGPHNLNSNLITSKTLTLGHTPAGAAGGGGTKWWGSVAAPTLYTLHPTTYVLHPTPYTLHPTPYTQSYTPATPHTCGSGRRRGCEVVGFCANHARSFAEPRRGL